MERFAVHDEILRRLATVEQEQNVRILFAIESGSRAWGFASPDSDYDVRFVYVHPMSWYLAINSSVQRDTIDAIEYPIVDVIDLAGWDVRKALNLYAQSPLNYAGSRRLLTTRQSLSTTANRSVSCSGRYSSKPTHPPEAIMPFDYDKFHNAMSVWCAFHRKWWPSDAEIMELAKQLGIEIESSKRPPLPESVIRRGDMGEDEQLTMLREEDGDIILSLACGEHFGFPTHEVQFCVPGTGGGRSPNTHRALLALMHAINEDNLENPL